MSARSIAVAWRPGKFVVGFNAGTLVKRIDGHRLHDSAFYPRGQTAAREPEFLGAYELAPAHQNFIDAMMIAEPEADRLERKALQEAA